MSSNARVIYEVYDCPCGTSDTGFFGLHRLHGQRSDLRVRLAPRAILDSVVCVKKISPHGGPEVHSYSVPRAAGDACKCRDVKQQGQLWINRKTQQQAVGQY